MNWGPDLQNPTPDWTISVALENVRRGGLQVTEVTNLREAVTAWQQLDRPSQDEAILILERPVIIDGAQVDRLEGQGVAVLAERLAEPGR
jgi:hypothetical protein